MHVMKAGGTAVCQSACVAWGEGEAAEARRPRVNCRLDEKEDRYGAYLASLPRGKRDSVARPELARFEARSAMAAHPGLCNTIMVEPGYRLDATARQALDGVLGHGPAYAWVLLVRDPIARFVSFAAMDQRKAPKLTQRAFVALLRGEGGQPRRYQLQLHNFLTRHLQSSRDFDDRKICTRDRLAAALERLEAYDVVLNLADRREASYALMDRALGLPVASRTANARESAHPGGDEAALRRGGRDAAAYARSRGYDLSADDLRRLRDANTCDLAVVKRADARMSALLATHGLPHAGDGVD